MSTGLMKTFKHPTFNSPNCALDNKRKKSMPSKGSCSQWPLAKKKTECAWHVHTVSWESSPSRELVVGKSPTRVALPGPWPRPTKINARADRQDSRRPSSTWKPSPSSNSNSAFDNESVVEKKGRSPETNRLIPSRHVQDPVRFDVEGDFNLRQATWRWRDPIEMELPKRLVVLSRHLL